MADDSAGQPQRPKLKAPPGACDCHMHFYGPRRRFSYRADAPNAPPPASVDDYRAVRARLGLARTVVVQPSVYGTDNTCNLEAMAELGAEARGVMVVDTEVSDAELARLTGLGVCGERFYMLGGVLGWDILDEMAARVHDFGWHVQLQLDGRELGEREAALRRLPGTLVIDHVGRFGEPVGVDHPGFRALMRLVEGGRCWVKLSMPYDGSRVGPPNYDDVGVLAKALVRAAPERMLWASNWPHPTVPVSERPDDAVLLDVLLDWVGDDATRHRILVDNPADLYGFD
ncbi:MAG: amidohydrolase family protein [Alphaproteobacteria bacterium]